jgi:hypothetical protein
MRNLRSDMSITMTRREKVMMKTRPKKLMFLDAQVSYVYLTGRIETYTKPPDFLIFCAEHRAFSESDVGLIHQLASFCPGVSEPSAPIA